MAIKYLGIYSGPSYGFNGRMDADQLEGFSSIQEAKDELHGRLRAGYGYVTTYARNANDLFVPWELDKEYDFPATSNEDYIELYRVERVGAGLYWKRSEPSYRLTVGPRGGIKVEAY